MNIKNAVILVFIGFLLIAVLSSSFSISSAEEQILQPDLIPFPIAGSTQLHDGMVLVIAYSDWINNQVWKSTDQGSTWTYVSTIWGSTPSGSEKMYCTDKDTILVVDGGNYGYQAHIYRSTDRGITWTVTYLFNTDEGPSFNIFEDTNGRIYVPVYSTGESINHARLLRSIDDGASWQQVAYWPGYVHCHYMFVNKYNGYIYVAVGDETCALMRSADNGNTWTNLDSTNLWLSINGKGDSNTVYLGNDWANSSSIYSFADDGSGNINLELVYDYGSPAGGYPFFLQIVGGKLVFGTVVEHAGDHCVLGVSDATWSSFSIVEDAIAIADWTGFYPCTMSYWNINKIYVSFNYRGTAFQPSSPPLSVTISPTSSDITVGGSQQFNSTVTGGSTPYAYQWYLNGTEVTGATSSTWNLTGTSVGTYIVYLNVTDNNAIPAHSNNATVHVTMSVAISPAHVQLYYGQAQTFSSTVTGGVAPYSFQWVLNGTAVPSATAATWMFTPRANGNYNVYLNVTDSLNNKAQSNIITDINVYSVNLLLTPGPNQTTHSKNQSMTFTVDVFNQLNPILKSTLTLTVTGPAGYFFYDFQPITVASDAVREYSFTWDVPIVAGTYIVETGLTPTLLTAYDIVLLK